MNIEKRISGSKNEIVNFTPAAASSRSTSEEFPWRTSGNLAAAARKLQVLAFNYQRQFRPIFHFCPVNSRETGSHLTACTAILFRAHALRSTVPLRCAARGCLS
jgi:hypothetical protein